MARTISVFQDDGGALLYDQPLGSESAIREWWSGPAAALGLPLLAAVYDEGFDHCIRWAGPELPQVRDELARLEQHWASAGLPADELAALRVRAGYLREAIALAEQLGGFVFVG